MPHHKKVLFLSLYTFGLTGGIEKVCRSIIKVLAILKTDYAINDYCALSMYDTVADLRYTDKEGFTGFNGNRMKFGVATVKKALKSDIILMSHINLLFFGWLIKKLKPKTRIILFGHGIEIWGKLSIWKRRFLRRHVEIWAVRGYCAAVIQTKHGVDARQIKVANNCLDPYFAIPKTFNKPQYLVERYGLDKQKKVLFTLARLSSDEQYKGYDQVLAAMNSLPQNVHYLLAGQADEAENNRISALITNNHLGERVTLTGYIKETELTDHFLLADVFVMPSQAEGFGISFIEAAACGCKVIAGNCDGSKDALLDGELGALVDPLNPQAIKTAILKSLEETDVPKNFQQENTLMHFSFANYKYRIKKLLSLSE